MLLSLCTLLISYSHTLSFSDLKLNGTLSIEPEESSGDAINWVSLERLVYRNQKKKETNIRTLDQLRGLCKIGSPRAALEFVRIDSTPYMFNLFGKGEFFSEIISRNSMGNLLLGLAPIHTKWLRFVEGESGVVSEDLWRQRSFEPPKVERKENAYHIYRYLLHRVPGEKETAEIVYAQDFVTSDGMHSRSIIKVVDSNPGWSFRSLADLRRGGIAR